MKKFSFELEEILGIRKFQQQQAEAELGKALADEKKVQDELDSLAARQVSVQNSMKGSVSFADITAANQFYSYARNQCERLLQELSQLKLVSEQKRESLRQAMQRTEALEKLRDEQKQEFDAAVKKQEMKEIDDIVTSRVHLR